jgi:hypothetical protein
MPVNEEGEDGAAAPVRGKGTRRAPNFETEDESWELPPTPIPAARRVYALPQDLVDRIVEFQREKGYPSEVEAVRRLLDEALKYRDTTDKIVSRFMSRLRSMRITSEVAKDVLVAHPLISTLSFGQDHVSFAMKDRLYEVTIYDSGAVSVAKQGSNPFEPPRYRWTPSTEDKFGPGRVLFIADDDDIPF